MGAMKTDEEWKQEIYVRLRREEKPTPEQQEHMREYVERIMCRLNKENNDEQEEQKPEVTLAMQTKPQQQ